MIKDLQIILDSLSEPKRILINKKKTSKRVREGDMRMKTEGSNVIAGSENGRQATN